MAVRNILLMREAKETIERVTDIVKLDHLLPYFDPDFPCLQYADPYGLAIFNRWQMKVVIPEWDRLADRLRTDEE